jgi:hypothetical protein
MYILNFCHQLLALNVFLPLNGSGLNAAAAGLMVLLGVFAGALGKVRVCRG